MSEFKYACPVCGQHILCDSSQSGTLMDCPTCLQKLVVPQAPASADSKLIITAQKYVEKKRLPEPDLNLVTQPKSSPVAIIVIVLVMALMAGAATWLWMAHQKAAAPTASAEATASPTQNNSSDTAPAPPPKKEKVAVAPPASDANWLTDLSNVTIPTTTVVGRIHGQDFIDGRTFFQNGTLTMRVGTRGPIALGLAINFQGATADSLSDKTINVTTNITEAAQVTLRWQVNGETQKENYKTGYALRLEFGTFSHNKLPGSIYLCTPDAEKSYVMGTFRANVAKPKVPAAPAQ